MATINLGNVDFAILFQGSGTLTASYSASLIGGGGIAGGACGTPGAGTSATLIGGGGIGGGTLGTPGQSLYVVSLIGGGGIAGGTLGQGSILASGSYAVTLIGGGGIAGGSISAAQSGATYSVALAGGGGLGGGTFGQPSSAMPFPIGGLVVDRSQLTSADDYLAAYVYFDCTQIAGFDPTQQYWFRYRQVAADPGPWSAPFLLGFTTPLAPTNLTASVAAYNDRIVISWDATPSGETITVLRAASSDFTTALAVATGLASSSYTDLLSDGLTAGQPFYYWATANDYGAASPAAGPVTGSVAGTTPIGPVSGVVLPLPGQVLKTVAFGMTGALQNGTRVDADPNFYLTTGPAFGDPAQTIAGTWVAPTTAQVMAGVWFGPNSTLKGTMQVTITNLAADEASASILIERNRGDDCTLEGNKAFLFTDDGTWPDVTQAGTVLQMVIWENTTVYSTIDQLATFGPTFKVLTGVLLNPGPPQEICFQMGHPDTMNMGVGNSAYLWNAQAYLPNGTQETLCGGTFAVDVAKWSSDTP